MNASVTEVWDVFLNEGTEGHRSYPNLGDVTIDNFSVSDETGSQYESLSYWKSSASFEQIGGFPSMGGKSIL